MKLPAFTDDLMDLAEAVGVYVPPSAPTWTVGSMFGLVVAYTPIMAMGGWAA